VADERLAAPIDPHQASANLRGMALVVIGTGAFVINDTLMKATSAELPLGEIVTIRGIMSCCIMAPIVILNYGLASIARAYSRALLLRNLSEIGAVFFFLTALFQLPMANVSGVLQAVPLTITAAAALFLGEPVGWRRWTASAVGLIGVLLIIQPGSTEFSSYYFAAIAAVLCVACRDISTRFIAKSAPSLSVTFVTALVVTLFGAVLGLGEDWKVPSYTSLTRLAGASILVLVGYYTMIEAMRTAEISAVAPFRYSVVIWAILLGYLVFNEIPSVSTIIGSLIVVSAGLYTFHRERVVLRRSVSARRDVSVSSR
jgi:drug/metabolite transporter (DMT)-like permease